MLLLPGVFGVLVLLKHPFQGHFLFSIRQHDLFKYSDVLKLIHDLWYVISGPTPQYNKHPHIMMLAPPCFTVFSVLWLEFSVWGSFDKLWPLDTKRTVNVYPLQHMFISTVGLCRVFLLISWLHIDIF